MLKENVTCLYKLIEEGKTIEALERFYSDDVSIQENDNQPRIGKQLNIENELNNLRKTKELHAQLINFAINEETNTSFSEWRIYFLDNSGNAFFLEEVSVQRWENSKVVVEKFYYKNIKAIDKAETYNKLVF